MTVPTTATIPPVRQQAERLVGLGVHEHAGLTASQFRVAAAALPQDDGDNDLLALHPGTSVAALAALMTRAGRSGFVVVDMADADEFRPIESVVIPDGPLYLVRGPHRGDEMANWSPEEALPAIVAAGRSPLLLTEGIAWLLQRPDVLERGRCFMTIGSRLRRPDGRLDARTPAIWISGGTGRDGAAHRGAPKVGWCWAGNRHTWLGFASCSGRAGSVAASGDA